MDSTAPKQSCFDTLRAKYHVLGNFLPLAIGFREQLLAAEPDLDTKTVGDILWRHTGNRRYLRSCLSNDVRYNLDGSPAEPVTNAQRDFVRGRLGRIERSISKKKEKAVVVTPKTGRSGRPVLSLKKA